MSRACRQALWAASGLPAAWGAALPFPNPGEVVVHAGLPDQVTCLAAHVQALTEVPLCLVVVTQLEVGIGEEAVGVGLCGRVGQAPGGSHGDAPGGHLVVPVS